MSDHLTLLVVKADFAPHVQVSEHGNFAGLMNTHILHAQLYDVRPVLGDTFYADMVLNLTDPNYVALLDGGEYTYQGKTYFFQGVKKAIVHYAYSRYALRGSVQDTASGLVKKANHSSETLDIKEYTKEAEYHKNLAVAVMNEVVLYLKRNTALYPAWTNRDCDANGTASRTSIRITPVYNN
jgi:hypothetical protein